MVKRSKPRPPGLRRNASRRTNYLFPKITKSTAFWKRLAQQEPNNAEMQLFGVMCYMKLPYRYTGNGQFILMGLAPDFVHLRERKIIELYGERWHLPEEEAERIETFARSDYRCIVIWQRELRIRNRANLYERLRSFDALPELGTDNEARPRV